ncbi:hypothetical protein LCGC14_1844940 [marine sediment metagenome]|uniref:Uncharacterized protein n=1 Tax=marine sediment metagenome TaxID=412755 RepID=A0A0F9GCC6_9ZZZZ
MKGIKSISKIIPSVKSDEGTEILIMDNKQELKKWDLLKSRGDYSFFYHITKMMSYQKNEEFGADFLKNLQILTNIIKNGKEQDAKIYIDSLKGKERKIVAADTYFTMLKVYIN